MLKKTKQYYNSTKFDFEKFPLEGDFEPPITWTRIFYKTYPRFPSKKLKLPKSELVRLEDFGNLLFSRETSRDLSGQIDYKTLSKLLFFSMGIKPSHNQDIDSLRRMYPSAGARYPIETYLTVNNVSDLDKGIYHYNIKENTLERLLSRDLSEEMTKILNSEMGKAPLLVALTGVLSRTEVKYGENAYRFALIESGHIGQNLYLLSQNFGLGCCAIGGFDNNKLSKLIDLTNDEVPLYMFAIGLREKSKHLSEK